MKSLIDGYNIVTSKGYFDFIKVIKVMQTEVQTGGHKL